MFTGARSSKNEEINYVARLLDDFLRRVFCSIDPRSHGAAAVAHSPDEDNKIICQRLFIYILWGYFAEDDGDERMGSGSREDNKDYWLY